MENENNLTSYTSEVNSTEKCQSYMEQIMNIQNENLIGILMSFLEYNDLINFQQTNKTIYTVVWMRNIDFFSICQILILIK